jgi:hypothetical protein
MIELEGHLSLVPYKSVYSCAAQLQLQFHFIERNCKNKNKERNLTRTDSPRYSTTITSDKSITRLGLNFVMNDDTVGCRFFFSRACIYIFCTELNVIIKNLITGN